jgi:hypothetical protein
MMGMRVFFILKAAEMGVAMRHNDSTPALHMLRPME